MDKQNVVYTYTGILINLKKEWGSGYNRDEFEDIMLSKRSQTQKAADCVILFM